MLSKKSTQNLHLLFICLVLTSCQRKADITLQNSLDLAGSNKKELQKVLDYYAAPGDSLKRKAAEFLILHMHAHEGYSSQQINEYERVFSVIDTQRNLKKLVSDENKKSIGDSLSKILNSSDFQPVTTMRDDQLITANYLINNIEFAFKAWKKSPWGKNITFKVFCEYILPYRVRNEKLESWRPALFMNNFSTALKADKNTDLNSVHDYMKWKMGFDVSFTNGFENYFPFPQSIGNLVQGKIGGCEATTYYATAALRSVGIPAAMDYIPHWGNANSKHWLTHLVNGKSNKFLITNDNNVKINTWSFVDFSSEYAPERHHFTLKELPTNLYVNYVRTIPKIYRYMYSQDSALVNINQTVPRDFIPEEFQNCNLKDVTDEYLKCAFITFDVKPEFQKYKAIYLCAFDISGWKPVAATKITNHFADFEKLGCYTVYLPAVYDKGKYISTGDPFYLDSLNIIRKFRKDLRSRQKSVELTRKAPMYSYTAFHSETLKNGHFEGANKPDFSDAEVIATIDYYPFYMNEAKVKNDKLFRYLRYVPPPNGSWEADNIAEVQFFSQNSENVLAGKYIGTEGVDGHGIEKAFDGDITTFYQNANIKNGWIGLDLGEGHQKKISKIKFCPKNDSNCIIPQNEYELYYWDGKWISLGSQRAVDYQLTYKNLPSNCLFWLKCKSGGVEERIFSVENGRQLWW